MLLHEEGFQALYLLSLHAAEHFPKLLPRNGNVCEPLLNAYPANVAACEPTLLAEEAHDVAL